jgi:hypothetical protein
VGTRQRARRTSDLIAAGVDADEAVAATRLLHLFAYDDSLAALPAPMPLSCDERRRVVAASCAELEQACVWLLDRVAAVHPAGQPIDLTRVSSDWSDRLQQVVGLYREIAACAPSAVSATLVNGPAAHPSLSPAAAETLALAQAALATLVADAVGTGQSGPSGWVSDEDPLLSAASALEAAAAALRDTAGSRPRRAGS